MSSPTRPSESRLHALRTRRMVEDTAIAAAGGGHLAALVRDHEQPARWRAEVVTGTHEHLRLVLDLRDRTVEIRRAGKARRAA